MTARYHFAVDALWVNADVLGSKTEVEFEGKRCVINFPLHQQDFGRHGHDVAIGGFFGERDAMTKAAVLMLRIDVEMPGELTAADIPSGVKVDESVANEAYAIAREGADIARRLVAGLVAGTRVTCEQYWLGPTHEPPRVAWLSSLLDASGERLAFSYNDPMSAHGISDTQPVLTAEGLQEIVERAAGGVSPSLGKTLLADAKFYAWRSSEPNPRLGLLLAAIACEVAIKTFITEHAKDEQRSLVDLVLDNPRDVSVAAVTLFDKGLKAAVGFSMREENREVYKDVDRLFQHRNRFAHKGVVDLSEEEVRADIGAASDAFAYLDGLGRRLER